MTFEICCVVSAAVLLVIDDGHDGNVLDSKLTYFGAKLYTLFNTTFRPGSTGLDHALVVACGLTQILVGQSVSLITKRACFP